MTTQHTHTNNSVLTVTAIGLFVTLVALLWHNSSAVADPSDAVASAGDFTILASDGGNEDVVLVLDNRNEELLAYKIRNQNQIELLQRASLAELFERGKAGETRSR
ncbi:MAG: hypothetical protein H6815_02400 [Phycisphaeraceae bacterium]|nr:hypothetical protein [Phycisphaerales bacterium]MCB9859278.1 hypothetical protein [Phycisphaeraceae bacterium]